MFARLDSAFTSARWIARSAARWLAPPPLCHFRPLRGYHRAAERAIHLAARYPAAGWLALLVCLPAGGLRAENPAPAGEWRQARPGFTYQFPADHAAHPDFKTEWWYFTGTLRADDSSGREFGYELTFFRQGVLPPGPAREAGAGGRSRFVQNDFKFAHLAVTDLAGGKFHFAQRTTRGAFGEAGFGPAPGTAEPGGEARLAWIEDWELTPQADGAWRISARSQEPAMAVELRVDPRKPPVIQGLEGVSQKAAGAGNASHYYSFTRLETAGTLTVGGRAFPVRGESWFDHEWASNGLAPDQVGWDWFCFQFDDNTELMLYAMRRKDGSVDPVSGGTFVDANGRAAHLARGDFELKPTRTWRSAKTGASYPVEWQARIPARGLAFTIRARLDDQELALPPISYWEGAIAVSGTRADGAPLAGHGYMELTGYAGALVGLSSGGAGETPGRTGTR